MNRQLHNSPRHARPGTEQHRKECVERVISENLVSMLRFRDAQDLTLGFTTKNRVDAVGVIERFLSIERRLPSPGSLARDLLTNLERENDSLTYHFPFELAVDRDLALRCAFVEVKRCSENLFTVCFGNGFSCPKLCAELSHPQIAIQHLDFSLLHIPNSGGTKAFSVKAATQMLLEQLRASGIEVESSQVDQLRIKYSDHELSVTTSLRYCENSSSYPIQTREGLFVIPLNTIPPISGLSDERFCVSISGTPSRETHADSATSAFKDLLGSTSQRVRDIILTMYGERKHGGIRTLYSATKAN